MNEYKRENPLFSACGLNCGLCPRYYTEGTSKCPGCGGEGFFTKHPPCGLLSCSQRHGVDYCCLCGEYPCQKYDKADASDSFITHKNQLSDFEKAGRIGMDAYCSELNEKVKILTNLLNNFNDGRRKNTYCIAVNLLELQDVRLVMKQIEADAQSAGTTKEKADIAARRFQDMAAARSIELKLRRNGRAV